MSKSHVELVRWIAKSGFGLTLNLALLTVWVDGAGIRPELAVFINWAILSVYGYLMARWWVFDDAISPDGVRGHLRQYVGMQGILAGGKLVNYVVYVALVWLHIDYRVAWVLGAGVGLLVSFGGNREWWTEPTPTDG